MLPEGLITAARIETEVMAGSKKRALATIASLLAGAAVPGSSEQIFECLLEREWHGSTGVRHGVALPHARSRHVKEATGAFIRLTSPMRQSGPAVAEATLLTRLPPGQIEVGKPFTSS